MAPKKVLIITSSGGGGILTAAQAKKQEIEVNSPSTFILTRDVMKDWVWGPIGKFCVSLWNNAQMRGDVFAQTIFGTSTPIAAAFFWPHIFIFSLYTLFKEDVDRVIDTQVLGTSALLKAIRIYNWINKKNVILEKYLVDFPTKGSKHFFSPIKKLGNHDLRQFKLFSAIPPLLENGECEKEFWLKHCNLPISFVEYTPFYVRQAFHRVSKKKEEQTIVYTQCKSEEEKNLIQNALTKGSNQVSVQGLQFQFKIDPKAKVFLVLLGSQPSQVATFNYVKNFIDLARKFPNTLIHFFVFCANHKEGEETLLKRISLLIAEMKDYPKNITIIPMSFQSDEILAPIFVRADGTCSRSGGQTLMELMCVQQKEIWIHSETKFKEKLTLSELLAGIPVWESHNAAYMHHLQNAKIVTPETFMPFAEKVLT